MPVEAIMAKSKNRAAKSVSVKAHKHVADSQWPAFGAVHQGLWFDVGTPKAISMTEAALENA